MLRILKLLPVILKYVIQVGPMIFQMVKWIIQIMRVSQRKVKPGNDSMFPPKGNP